jgi:hypothetical protein
MKLTEMLNFDNNLKYEIKAEAFRIMTGQMAPGKDPSIASSQLSFEERSKMYEEWNKKYFEITNAMWNAMKEYISELE